MTTQPKDIPVVDRATSFTTTTQSIRVFHDPERPRGIFPLIALAVVTVAVITYAVFGARASTADMLGKMALLIALAQSWNLMAGFSGMISLGIAAFVGSGSYAVAMLMIKVDLDWWMALTAVLPIALVLALVLSVPLMRLRGDYFAIASLAASLALQSYAQNLDFLGGSAGFTLPFAKLPGPNTVVIMSLLLGALATGLVIYMKNSRFGLKLQAARDNEGAAQTLGVAIKKNHIVVFILGSVLASLVGGILALHDATVNPQSSFAMSWTIGALLMAVVGGVGTITGPIIGTVIVYWLLQRQLESFNALAIIIEGALLIVLIRVAPKGLWPLIARASTAVWNSTKRFFYRGKH